MHTCTCTCTYTCVKVWDTHRKTSIAPTNERVKKSPLILEFKGHQYGVQCCAISPGERLVMSADIDSCIMVGEVRMYIYIVCIYMYIYMWVHALCYS